MEITHKPQRPADPIFLQESNRSIRLQSGARLLQLCDIYGLSPSETKKWVFGPPFLFEMIHLK